MEMVLGIIAIFLVLLGYKLLCNDFEERRKKIEQEEYEELLDKLIEEERKG